MPRHRAAAGQSLTAAQVAENRESVFGGWRMHYDDVRHSLAAAYYQGWDLHPAQLPTRYAAVFGFENQADANKAATLIKKAAAGGKK